MGKSWEIIRKSLKVVINSWEIQQTVMRKLWESHEKAGNSHDFLMRIMKSHDNGMINLWLSFEKFRRESWERPDKFRRKTMRKLWENHDKVMRKS